MSEQINVGQVMNVGPLWWLDPMLIEMGAQSQFDYAGESTRFKDRVSRCYELASKAFISLDPIPTGIPEPLAVVHGSWSCPDTRDEPIDHAWVLLVDGRVWEPITMAICDRQKFYTFTQGQANYVYDRFETRRMMTRTLHFGPWTPMG